MNKKTGKRLIGILLCLAMLFGIMPMTTLAVSAEDNGGSTLKMGTPVDYFGRNALSALTNSTALLYAYDQIVAGVEASSAEITVYNGVNAITSDEIEMVMDAYRRDYAHHFWLGNTYQIVSSSGSAESILPTYIITGTALDAAKEAFEQKAAQILSGLTGEMGEYEKELYLHDQLAKTVIYAEADHAHNAYGALVEGTAVCEGYAEALQYLLQRAGIQSFIAIGASINPSTGTSESHAWNYVRIGGKYYHTDLTWDDQGKNLYHAYFNQTDAVIQEDHAIAPANYALPVCDSAAAQYFTGKSEYLSSYTAETVGTLLKDNARKVHVYIPGSMDDFLSWYNANIVDIATKAGISGSFSYGYMKLGRELILQLSTVCEHTYGDDHLCTQCGEEEAAYVSFYSLSLTGNIGINYYMHLSNDVAADAAGYMRFTVPGGATVDVPISKAVMKRANGKDYYMFTMEVSAKEMTSTVSGQYFYDGGSSEVYSYSVKDYADIIIANTANSAEFEKAKPLVQAMLVYGAYAQNQFNYNTEKPAAALADVSSVNAAALSAFANTQAQGTALAPFYGASLILKSETTLRLFFHPDSAVTNLTVTFNGNPLSVKQSGKLFYVDITNISAKDLDASYTVTVNDGTASANVTYTPMAYCYNVLSAAPGTYSDTLLNTVRALYLYNQAANTYFG